MAEYSMITFGGKPFYAIKGKTAVMGTGGPLFTYQICVQKGAGLRLDTVVKKIDSVLGHKSYGWTRSGGVRFQRVDTKPGTYLLIAQPDTVDKLCYPLDTAGEVSCRNGNKVILNLNRWKTGVPHWTDGIDAYRTMLINHEMGHRIGQRHRTCPGKGRSAPVMQQQTYGFQGCKANWWPLGVEVAALTPAPRAMSLMNLVGAGAKDESDLELE